MLAEAGEPFGDGLLELGEPIPEQNRGGERGRVQVAEDARGASGPVDRDGEFGDVAERRFPHDLAVGAVVVAEGTRARAPFLAEEALDDVADRFLPQASRRSEAAVPEDRNATVRAYPPVEALQNDLLVKPVEGPADRDEVRSPIRLPE